MTAAVRVPIRSEVVGLWEAGEEQPRPPEPNQFKVWLDSEPPFETWAKIKKETGK